MEINKLYSLFLTYPKISTDSRKVEKDSIFFALKGDKFDGNTFAEKAIGDGAKFAVIDNPEYKKSSEYIVVNDVLEALQNLARYHVSQLKPKLKVVGLTGSNGKTTTKELIAKVLSRKFKVQYTEGNYNNHIGVPLTILKVKNDTEIAVIEMGANHQGEIALLASIARPDIGLITNIGEAHIEGFGSIEGVLEAKSELFDYLIEEKGLICLNTNDQLLSKKYTNIDYDKVILYGSAPKSIVEGEIKESSLISQIVSLNFEENYFNFETKLIGKYNLDNFLAAAAIGKFFNISNNIIIDSLAKYEPNLKRSQFLETNSNKLIVDTYNANPTSMKAALENFNQLDADNKIVILGGMKELGKDSNTYHKQIIDLIESFNFRNVFLVGSEFLEIKHSFKIFRNTDELAEELNTIRVENNTILIKGSRANQLEKIIEFL